MAEAAVIPLQERIKASRRAKAVERAWQVAKALEGNRSQIAGLSWIAPENDQQAGIRRTVDFASEFPEGVTPLYPTAMDISVCAPANILVPDEDMKFAWTMPLLARMSPAPETLDERIRNWIGVQQQPSLRNRIDLISFLPFAKEGAPHEEQFSPQFYVTLNIRTPLKEDAYYAAVALYGGKAIKQMVTDERTRLHVFADPYHATPFKAEMLVSLTPEQLATTAANAGELEIFVYQISASPGAGKIKDAGTIIDFDGKANAYLDSLKGLSGFDRDPMAGLMRGGSSFSAPTLSLSSLGGSYRPPVPPAQAPKQVGDVRLGEGTQGEAVKYNSLEGYGFDGSFGIQPIRIRFLGVREQSEQQARDALRDMSARYSS